MDKKQTVELRAFLLANLCLTSEIRQNYGSPFVVIRLCLKPAAGFYDEPVVIDTVYIDLPKE